MADRVSTVHPCNRSNTTAGTGPNSNNSLRSTALGSGTQTVTVDCLDDAYGGSPTEDRNLYLEDVVQHNALAPVDAALYSAGTLSVSSYMSGHDGRPVSLGAGPDSIASRPGHGG